MGCGVFCCAEFVEKLEVGLELGLNYAEGAEAVLSYEFYLFVDF